MDRLDMMRLFVRIVETGSFSEAARIEKIAQSTASKCVAALEARLGVQLADRSARTISVTPAGREFYEGVSRLLASLNEAEARVARGSISPSGRIRVSLASALGRLLIVPRIPEFISRYPELSVDLDVVASREAEALREADIEIQVGLAIGDRTLVRCIGSASAAIVATPAYIARCGRPEKPGDLGRHQCIGWTIAGDPVAWEFAGPDGPSSVLPSGGFRTNDAENVRAAVLCGLGIGYGPAWLFADEVASGALWTLLDDYLPGPWPISAVCSKDGVVPNRVRVFVDFLTEVFAGRDLLRIR